MPAIKLWAFLAPTIAKTAPEIIARLNSEIRLAMADGKMRKQLTAVGIEPLHSTPEAFARLIRSELERWGKIVKASGARVD